VISTLSGNALGVYCNSPYFTPGQYINVAPVNQPLPTEPLPRISPYDTVAYQRYQQEVNAYRLYQVFNDQIHSYCYQNSDDSTVITITPKYVDDRSLDGVHFFSNRSTGTESLFDADRMLTANPDGTVEADEHGNVVRSLPDGDVEAFSQKSGMHQIFPAATFDAMHDLAGPGYLSPYAASLFAQTRDDHNLADLSVVRSHFAPSALNAISTAQYYDSLKQQNP
jgi:hypothetical protein